MTGPVLTSTANRAVSAAPQLCIVVLDDSEFDRSRMRRMITQTSAGVKVVTCDNIADFKVALEQHPVDLCLVDHQLRDASGLDAIAALKDQSGCADVPVVMVSGFEDTESIVSSMRAGCVNYVGKESLTAQKLHDVIFTSIAETFSDPELEEQVNKAARDVISGLAQGCISELQPRLRRMYRQISFIRGCHAQGVLPSPEALDEIEDHCLNIWRFFDEVEAYSTSFGETRH
ncbi:response regulator [Phaeobacter italicus]|uniref:response regulator n=1 Tax=Phaeobacter italicus TaxID=481446 RepID=UPI001CD28416|nr:response regulator [Phaeobacter italicus]MCA0857086.1 response regulator [Phaeobacter italicus]